MTSLLSDNQSAHKAASKKKLPEFINKLVGKKQLNELLLGVYNDNGTAKTGMLANALKNLGFKYATLAGITISIEDLDVPAAKKNLMAEAEATIAASTQRYLRGEITEVERYAKVIDTWSETNEKLTQEIVDGLDRMNPIYMMAFSGARGNLSQVRQLVGMRGLMADSQGQIIDLPIKSNFREGLSVTEYIISSYGARKGLVDTALKTADSGYLTRRLVDVSQDVIITEADCGTQRGVWMRGIIEGQNTVVSLEERIISRSSAVDIKDKAGNVLVKAGDVIGPDEAKAIVDAGIVEVLVRSGLTCETTFGICQKCYGWSLTTNRLVDLGEAIGIMAAQSIGEPGTQLTMRTFHTGGVFSGSAKKEQVKVKRAGKIVGATLATRDFRTRHGEMVEVAIRDCEIKVEVAGKGGKAEEDTYIIPYNATIFTSKKGTEVTKGQILADFDPNTGRNSNLTEKATKDITSDLSGKVVFEGFDADEKRDRQGNISRTSNRGGTIWLLSGDVYNLPAGSELNVEDSQLVLSGDQLAETTIVSEYGGEVRLPEDLSTAMEKLHGEEVEIIQTGKELTVIIASVNPANAEFVQTKKEMLWKVNAETEAAETYIIKSPHGTVVESGSIVAELLDDTCSVPTSGEIRYEGIEVDEQQIITQAGKVLFIPEEIHQVSKDSSLKAPGIETGTFVKAGTELVAGINARIDGVVHMIEENDIIHEVVVRPGQLHRVNDVATITVDDGTIVEAGVTVAPGIKTTERSMITITFNMDDPPEDADEDDLDDTAQFEYAELLVRPVYEFEVAPREVAIDFVSTEPDNIRVIPVTQMQYADGAKIRQVEGASLIRTSLVLQTDGYLNRLKGVTELQKLDDELSELRIVVLENLTIRREVAGEHSRTASSIKTQLLVQHGDLIEKKTPVVKTQVLARTNGAVMLPQQKKTKDVRRVLLVTPDHTEEVALKGEPIVSQGAFVRVGQPLDDKGTIAQFSARVAEVGKKGLTMHRGRPYLISQGAQLQAENENLAQQGDTIATLVYERLKTGDIVQGLPKVEELLEGRKPKEIALLAPHDATVEVVFEDDIPSLFISHPDFGRQEVSIPLGANLLVEDKQAVTAGQPLTDGSINPHDLLETSGIEAVRQFLVDEVQRVYRSQGVDIADKHIEIIVRQMTRKVQVDDSGETYLLGGEMVDLKVLNEANRQAQEQELKPAVAHPVLLGITKASLNTESFISAASFQETTRVLTEAAVEGKADILRGLKENVIIGRLIPAGTGFPAFKDQRTEHGEQEHVISKSAARKPSAILEEIESMFGSPDLDALSDFLLDDSGIAGLSIRGGEDEDILDEGAEEELLG